MEEILEWIWWYHKNGFSIIPLGNNPTNDPKKPSLKSWDKYKKTLATEEEIKEWIDEGLFKNVAVICGHVSNDLVVIDIDDKSIKNILELNFDSIVKEGSWVVETGKGYHIYCKHHSNPGGIKKPIKHKIEYRANNGYVVAPPSVHPNGKQYCFYKVKNFSDLKSLKPFDVKVVFNEMKEKIGNAWGIKKKEHSIHGVTKKAEMGEYPACVEIALGKVTKHPMRYYTIYGILSSFVFQGIPKDMAERRIKEFNMVKCSPPHSKDIIRQAVDGAYSEGAHLYGCEFWMDDADLCPFENIMECPFGRKKAKRELAKEYKIFEFSERTSQDGKKFLVPVKVRNPKLAELILNEFDFNFCTLNDTKEIFYYNGGCYHSQGENTIRYLAEDFMGDLTTTHNKNEIEGYIRDYNYIDRNCFSAPVHLINLENGVYDMENFSLCYHSPNKFFINKLPVSFNPDAKINRIEQFLTEILRKDDIKTIQEEIGYCLYRDYRIQKAFMYIGEGSNGKSTLLSLMKNFFGMENVSSVSLHDLVADRFASADLYGKLANIYADLSSKSLSSTGVFKMLTGGDIISAQQKFKGRFNFVNYAKLFFSCNRLPDAPDDTEAYFRRWIPTTFPNKFEGKDKKINLLKELTTKEELSGLFNWGIEGLKRLLENHSFTYNQSTADIQDYMERLANPVTSFVRDRLEVIPDCYIEKDDLYESYKNYCAMNGLDIFPKQTFTKRLQMQPIPLQDFRPAKVEGRPRPRCWKGVRDNGNELINNFIVRDENEEN